jgi:hypothetical protein
MGEIPNTPQRPGMAPRSGQEARVKADIKEDPQVELKLEGLLLRLIFLNFF